jgi:hypothetical protein
VNDRDMINKILVEHPLRVEATGFEGEAEVKVFGVREWATSGPLGEGTGKTIREALTNAMLSALANVLDRVEGWWRAYKPRHYDVMIFCKRFGEGYYHTGNKESATGICDHFRAMLQDVPANGEDYACLIVDSYTYNHIMSFIRDEK